MVGEGIESCLAAMQARGLPAWAALSTSGLLALDLPKDVRDVIVLADGDDAGEAAAQMVLHCAGSERDAACASLIRHKGWTSTTCCWAARPALWGACNERRRVSHRSRRGGRRCDRRRRGNCRSSGVEQAPEKPRLLVENCNPDRTVAALRDILAEAGGLYDRGVPVRLAFDQIQKGTVAQMMTPRCTCPDGACESVVLMR